MRTSQHRITLVCLAVFFQMTASAQIFDGIFPPTPPKAEPANPVASANFPTCGFDEMNEQRAAIDPVFQEEWQHYLEEVVPQLSAGSEKSMVQPLLTISVVVHIIHNGEPVGQGQNLSAAQVRAQIDILNEDFAAVNPQYFNTPSQWAGIAGVPNIQFCLANEKPDGSPTDGIDRQQMTVTGPSWNNNNINSTIKPSIKWDPLRYYNIYVLPIPGTTASGGVVGFSNYPTTGLIGTATDGVVIDYRWFGAPGFAASGYRPLSHETGHYLGLPHTFQGNSCSQDDGIADTPDIDESTRDAGNLDCEDGYAAGPVSCGNEHLYVNYMDYVTENCYTSFTVGQENVVRAVLNGTSQGFGYGSRNALIINAPLQCDIPADDAGITRVVNPASVSCTNNTLTPQVTLRNFGTDNLTSANIFYKINSGSPVSYAWSGSLFAGANLNVTLPAFTPPNGSYTFTAWITQPNGVTDQRTTNDSFAVTRFTHVAIDPPMVETFENETNFPTSEGIFPLNVSGDEFVWQLNTEVSGFGQGDGSVVFDNFNDINGNNPGGTIDALITRHFDFTDMDNAMLKFDVAYAPFIEDIGDTLLVLVATNCSQNFNQIVYERGGVDLSTAPVSGDQFTPTATQWRTETIDLSAYDGMSDVTIALVNYSAFGNRLFVDNIGVGRNCGAITTQISSNQNGCNNPGGTCNGTATVTVANHNGGLSYQWQPANQNLPTASQLCPGQVTVTVTDALGCSVVSSTTIGQAPTPQLSTSSTQVTTYGGSNGTATVTATNGQAPYSYTWSNGFQQNNSNNSTSTANGLAVGTYTVTVTSGNGCSATASVTVGSVCNGFAVNTTVGNVSCNGGGNGSILATTQNGTGPFSFAWSNGGSGTIISNLTAGTYSVTATDANGCPSSQTATVTQPSALVLNVNSTNETAVGANNGTATTSASGGSPGYSFLWSNGATTSSINNLAPGNYTVTVTDAAGCTNTVNTTVNAFSCAGFQSNISSTNISCFGQNNGTATVQVTGGTSPVAYLWSNGSTSQTANNLPPGAVSVTVTDGAGCASQLSTSVSQPPLLVANANATNETIQNANNGTASVTSSGGVPNYSVMWSNGATALNISNLAPGNYTVTLTDANGCTATDQVTVLEAQCALALIVSNIPTTCPNLANGSVSVVSVSGGVGPLSYLWSNGQTTQTISNLTAGTYLVTVTDNAGCTVSGQVTVASADVTPPTVVTNDVVVSLGANGNVSLQPNDLDGGSFDNCAGQVLVVISQQTFDCDDVGDNVVQVTVTDASGNSSVGTATVTVTEDVPPVVSCPADLTVNTCGAVSYTTPTTTDNCSVAALELTSGLASGAVFPIGTTTVTWQATDGSGNATACSFEVTVVYDLAASFELVSPSCHGDNDGQINLTVTGGQAPYGTSWSNGGAPVNLIAGIYTVTVTDADGCTLVETLELTEPGELVIEVVSITPSTGGLPNGVIEVNILGGTAPFQFVWLKNGIPQPGFDPSAALPGSYQLRVEDANGCIELSGLLTVGVVSSTSAPDFDRFVKLFPNPSTGLVTLQFELPVAETVGVSVFDLTGRQVLILEEKTMQRQTETLDLQQFSAGVYWVKLMVGSDVVWRRLVKI